MKAFNFIIEGERGEVKIKNCKKFPTEEMVDEYIENFGKLGIGKAQKIIVEITS
jgi:hypothetical protein